MTIPASVLMKMATIGLSPEQAEAVAGMLSEVEAATLASVDEKQEAGKEKARERWRRWVSRLDVTPTEWVGLSAYVRERDNNTCTYCGTTEGPMHCDHVVPLSQGGTSAPDNLVTACRACNCGKSGRTVEQWWGLS